MVHDQGRHVLRLRPTEGDVREGGLLLLGLQENGHISDELLARCAEFFLSHGQYEKAVQLQITAGNIRAALELCMDHAINVSEKMAEVRFNSISIQFQFNFNSI